jgi:hypothetical protein
LLASAAALRLWPGCPVIPASTIGQLAQNSPEDSACSAAKAFWWIDDPGRNATMRHVMSPEIRAKIGNR